MKNTKLIILDRDGLIVEEGFGSGYLLKCEDICIKNGVLEAINILKNIRIPVVLATRQRCISKGLITRAEAERINSKLEEVLDFKFNQIFIEEKHDTKILIFGAILNSYKINPVDIVLIDNNITEVVCGTVIGFSVYHSENLLESLKLWQSL